MEQACTPTLPARPSPVRPYPLTGKALAEIREAQRGGKMTQHALGKVLGYSDTSANATVSKLENGSACPTAHALARLHLLDRDGTAKLLDALAKDIASGAGADG